MRRAVLAGRALVVLALGIPLFGWIDLTSTWRLGEDTTVWDIGYGGLTGIVLPAAFLWPSPVQALAGAAGYAAAGIAGGQARYVVVAGCVGAAAVILLGHRPRRVALRLPLAGLALLATPWLAALAVHATRKERAHLTSEAHAGLHAWAGVAAFAIAAALVAWMAAAGFRPRLAGWSVGAAVAYFGLASMLDPNAAASVGTALGAAAIAWGAAFAATAEVRR